MNDASVKAAEEAMRYLRQHDWNYDQIADAISTADPEHFLNIKKLSPGIRSSLVTLAARVRQEFHELTRRASAYLLLLVHTRTGAIAAGIYSEETPTLVSDVRAVTLLREEGASYEEAEACVLVRLRDDPGYKWVNDLGLRTRVLAPRAQSFAPGDEAELLDGPRLVVTAVRAGLASVTWWRDGRLETAEVPITALRRASE